MLQEPTPTGQLRDGLRLAFGTLTAWPVPAPGRVDRAVAGRAMALAPLTTVPTLAAVGAVSFAVRGLDVPPLVGAVLLVGTVTLGSRALHLDGLADTADGLSASYDRAAALDVMRRGNIGPSGVTAIVLVLLLDVAALATLGPSWRGLALAGCALLASRHVLAWACAAGVPSARPDGLGATVAGSVGRRLVAAATLAVAGACVALAAVAGGPWWLGGVVFVAGVLAGLATLRRALARFGGITGDVLGAVVEISFAASLTAAALLVSAPT